MKEEAEIIRTGAGVIMRPDLRTFELTGVDRVRYLNGMVSNDVTKLSPGTGQLAVKASNKGRIEGMLRIRMREDAILIDVRAVVAAKVFAVLEKFIVMDDCSIRDVSSERDVVAIHGPASKQVLAAAGIDPGALEPYAFTRSGEVVVVRDPWLRVDGYELHAPGGPALRQRLLDAGAKPISEEAVDAVRIEAGVPIDGVELGEDTIPLEARLEHAIDFTKGCYIGQEVISRATNLGQIRHVLVGLDLGGDRPPPRGAKIISSGKETGEVTSAVMSPTLGRMIGMGYVRSSDDLIGNWLTITDGSGGQWDATVAALPFVA
jgi:folate-binding protein YgfZ